MRSGVARRVRRSGGGSYFHQLHHAHFECNYGDAAFPTDWLFGTFEDGSRWAKTAAAMALEEALSAARAAAARAQAAAVQEARTAAKEELDAVLAVAAESARVEQRMALEAAGYGGAGLVKSVLAPRQAGAAAEAIANAEPAAAAPRKRKRNRGRKSMLNSRCRKRAKKRALAAEQSAT